MPCEAAEFGETPTPISVIPGFEPRTRAAGVGRVWMLGSRPLLSGLDFPFLNPYKTIGYWEIGIDFIVRDAGKTRIFCKIFASELSLTRMPSLAIIRLVAKVTSQNSKAAHLLRVSESSATVFAKPDSSGSRPSMTEGGVGISESQGALCWGIAAGPSLRQNLHPGFCAYHMNPATARLRRE